MTHTLLASNPSLSCGSVLLQRDIEAAEDLLETAFIQTNHILQRLNLLSERISSAELLVRIAMDRRRNELTALELWVTNISMGFAYVSAVGGIFGMNLWNSVYQESKPVFLWVIFACVVGFVGLPASLIIYMRKRRLDFIAERSM